MFYRDGVNFDNAAIRIEYKEVKAAAESRRENQPQPQITYVVLNKNSQITRTSDASSPSSVLEKRNTPVVPEIVFGTEADGRETYKYYVAYDEADLTETELIELVSSISAQSTQTLLTHPRPTTSITAAH